MFRREFYCNSCQHVWELWYESMHDNHRPRKCKSCKSKDIGQAFSTHTQYNCIDAASHMTVEKACEINRKFYGKEQLEKMADADPIMKARKQQKKAKDIWDDGVDIKKVKDKEKYIEHGEV